MGFHLAKCVHLQKGKCAFVQPCAMAGASAPINIWCNSLAKTKGKQEQKLKEMCGPSHRFTFSTQHIDSILCLQKKLEIGRNVKKNKGERNAGNIDFFTNLSGE